VSETPRRADPVRAPADECGCAPSPAEARAFWPQSPVSRRTALAVGMLGVAAIGAFGVGGGINAAWAATYPSWDDVQKARANEAAKGKEITRIEGLIQGLADNVAAKNAEAEAAANEFYEAQQAYFDAVDYADALQERADEQDALATEAAEKAARVAAQLYRTGGEDASLELFFAGSAAGADDLLARLGQMDKLIEGNQSIYDTAVAARNSAQQLSNQASVARDERDRLQKLAEDKLIVAQEAAAAAQAALDEQEGNLMTLEAQLAALKDTTAKTVAGYEAGVAERKRLEEERKRQEEERRRREAELAAQNGWGSGGLVGSGGWARPHGGRITDGYGPRAPLCGNYGCTSGFHRGVDFANGCGAFIYAAADGFVDAALWNGGLGNYIRIQHGAGIATGYAHIRPSGYLVSYGDYVSAGQAIAYAGDTGQSYGCHLHFEVYLNGAATEPLAFLRARGVSI